MNLGKKLSGLAILFFNFFVQSIVLITFTFLVFKSEFAAADSNQNEKALAGRDFDESRENEIIQKARKRLYPGGKDESDLKVQAQLVAPQRKLSPNMEIEAPAAEPAAED